MNVAHRSGRYNALIKKIDTNTHYDLIDALRLIQENANAKFDETIDIAIHLNIKKNDSVRGIVSWPNSFGKSRRILVFAKGEHVRHAESAGADYVGGADIIAKIKGGWLDFDIAIATPDMMREVSTLGTILGRRGLMPNLKAETVTMDIANTVRDLARGRREFRADTGGTVHAAVGKTSMRVEGLQENSRAMIDAVQGQRPDGHKGKYINSIDLSSTMGVGLTLELSSVGIE